MYDRRTVELLLPAVWDEEFAYGMRDQYAPDPDMPKVKSNKAHANTLYAMLADIRRAWDRAPVTMPERRALLLRYGMDWEQTDIAFNQGVTKQAINIRIERGVGRITAWLNGDTYIDGYEPSSENEMEAAAA